MQEGGTGLHYTGLGITAAYVMQTPDHERKPI